MDFELDQVQRTFQSRFRDVVDDHIVGENGDWDDGNFPEDVYQVLVDIGMLGLHLPEELDGQAVDPLTAGIAYEELGRGDVGLATLVLSENIATKILGEYGDEHHRDVAAEVARGEAKIAFGLTEPDHGSDASDIETTARRADDEWVFSGEKTAITVATLADYCLLFARLDDESEIGAFLLPTDQPGVEVQPYAGMGCEVSGWGQLYLDDARAPAGARVGEQSGFKMAMETFDKSRAWIGLYSLGAAQQTLDETEQYLTEREAFGKPLAGFEGPQFQVAELQTKVDSARLKAYETLWRATEGKPHTKDAAMVKWYAPDVAVETIHECLVLHGHYGYAEDFGIEQRLRDTIGLQIGDGTPQVQKLVIARETFGREYLPY
ncbi:MAG: cyclohexanecarboxyl-CoA dehydrogenase [Natronomonas sp.]|jgi:cyclohexanecarboxyl-CoA dehydrogenase|uniref:acyl-CoA dehydrogenase family protein n=1 Tax=Natronomonas sp. TaxID=2184060 RepID=UPI0039891453